MSVAKTRKWRPGDIIQVSLPTEFRYLQYVAKDLQGIDVLRIMNFSTVDSTVAPSQAGQHETLYWVRTFANVLVKDERFRYIGNAPSAGSMPVMRRRSFGGWIVLRDQREIFVQAPIDEKTARISLDQVVPASWILQHLARDWRPEDDRSDVTADLSEHLDRASATHADSRKTTFLVKFPSALSASRAQDILAQHGYNIEVEPTKRSLAVCKSWNAGDSLHTMDLIEAEIADICVNYHGEITGRETSA